MSRKTFHEPAHSIVTRLGGAATVAAELGVSLTCVYRWMWPRSAGGRGGIIPRWHYEGLLALARKSGVVLRRAEFYEVPEHRQEREQRRRVRWVSHWRRRFSDGGDGPQRGVGAA